MTAVVPISPAAAAGIVPGDVITQVNGHSIDGMAQLMGEVRRRRPGDSVDLTMLQGGATRSVLVSLAAATDTPGNAVAPPTTVGRLTASG